MISPWIRRLLTRGQIVDVTNAIGGVRRIGRVRAWGWRGRRYQTGDVVPHLRGQSTYSVQTTEGWFIHVVQGRIDSWSRHPVQETVADQFGRIGSVRIRRVLRGARG